jgi:rare lipoprotein A
MNKILPLLLIFVLCSCTTEQIRTSGFSDQSSVTTASTARHHSRFHLGSNEANLIPKITQYLKQGVASWYGSEFHGKKTASGEIYDMYAMTAAHKTLPISSYARVTNLENQRSVIVRINDRGPFHGNRVMDLSYAAAKKLDLNEAGTGAVEIKAIAPPEHENTAENQQKSTYLQTGSFGNKKTGQRLHNKIAAHPLPRPKALSSTHKGSKLNKVAIKSATDDALKQNTQLAKLGITTPQFVTESHQKQISMVQ